MRRSVSSSTYIADLSDPSLNKWHHHMSRGRTHIAS
jgi:hypothetical protein